MSTPKGHITLTEDNQVVIVPKTIDKLRESQLAVAKAKILEDEIRSEIMQAMEDYGIKSIKNDVFDAIYIPETVRNGLDTKRLKEEQPLIAETYAKVSNVKAQVRITFHDFDEE